MKIKKLSVNTYSQNYRILIGSNLISKLSVLLKKNSINFKKCLLLVDKNIPKNYVSKIKNSLSNKNREIHISFIRATESNKNQKNINNILETLLKKNFSRKDCLVSVGGGITGDMGGFAASGTATVSGPGSYNHCHRLCRAVGAPRAHHWNHGWWSWTQARCRAAELSTRRTGVGKRRWGRGNGSTQTHGHGWCWKRLPQ